MKSLKDETFSLIFKPSVVAIVFYFGIPFGVVFPSCQSYLIFCFAVSSLRGLLTHLLQRIGSRHIDLLLKFWVATEPRGSGNIRDFLQSCSRLTDTKKVSNDMMHENHLCKLKQPKVCCIFLVAICFFKQLSYLWKKQDRR